MAKMNKMYYYTSNGEKKLNCYTIPVPKQLVEEAKLEGVDLRFRVEKEKIIIEKKVDKK